VRAEARQVWLEGARQVWLQGAPGLRAVVAVALQARLAVLVHSKLARAYQVAGRWGRATQRALCAVCLCAVSEAGMRMHALWHVHAAPRGLTQHAWCTTQHKTWAPRQVPRQVKQGKRNKASETRQVKQSKRNHRSKWEGAPAWHSLAGTLSRAVRHRKAHA
jgi:hypothetical protein